MMYFDKIKMVEDLSFDADKCAPECPPKSYISMPVISDEGVIMRYNYEEKLWFEYQTNHPVFPNSWRYPFVVAFKEQTIKPDPYSWDYNWVISVA